MDQAETARRLKAARWLAGGVKENGRPKELSTADLARHPLLAANGITDNRLQEAEQTTTTLRPMELEKIAQALDLPPAFFDAQPELTPASLMILVQQVLDGLARAVAEGPWQTGSGEDETGPPGEAVEGDGG